MQGSYGLLEEGICSKHREEIIEVCVQAGCDHLLCEKCKTKNHKDHHTMELSDYKEFCLNELILYKTCLETYAAMLGEFLQKKDIPSVPLKKPKVQGKEKDEVEGSTEEAELFQCFLRQNERVQQVLESIERATDPFFLDPLASFQIIKETFNKMDEVYKEDAHLPEIESNPLNLYRPRIKINCGISLSDDVKVLCLCRSGDLVVAGEDVLENTWRMRKFTILGQLVWNKHPPLSWSSIDGMVEFGGKDEDALLVSNGDEGEVVYGPPG